MLTEEMLQQVRRIHLQAKKLVQSRLSGDYRSIFKGSGLIFDEVREYQPGDDVRTIDWNVTARMNQPFIKRFSEEREQTLCIVVDVSTSHDFGSRVRTKRTVAAEMAAVLALSAMANNDQVGLILGSTDLELFLQPGRGHSHMLRLVREILFFQPKHPGGSLANLLANTHRLLPKRAIVVLFSDFIDQHYQKELRIAAHRHDLIAVRITDPLEQQLPTIGWCTLRDAETQQQVVLNLSDRQVQAEILRSIQKISENTSNSCRTVGVDLLEVSTTDDHFAKLVDLFARREQRIRKHRQ
ncbi:MAG: DUF58 domain-containing protein [Zavarzinella sp.]